MPLADRCVKLLCAATDFKTWLDRESATLGTEIASSVATAVAKEQAEISRWQNYLRLPQIAIAGPSQAVGLRLLDIMLPGAFGPAPTWLHHFEHAIKRVSPEAGATAGMHVLRLLSPAEIVKIIAAATATCGPPPKVTAASLTALKSMLGMDSQNLADPEMHTAMEELRRYFTAGDFGERIRDLTAMDFWTFAAAEAPYLGQDKRRELLQFIWGSDCRRSDEKRCNEIDSTCRLDDLCRRCLSLLAQIRYSPTLTISDDALRATTGKVDAYLENGKAIRIDSDQLINLLLLTREVILPWPAEVDTPLTDVEIILLPPCSTEPAGCPRSGHSKVDSVFQQAKSQYLRLSSAMEFAQVFPGAPNATAVPEGMAAPAWQGIPAESEHAALRQCLANQVSLKARKTLAAPALDAIRKALVAQTEPLLSADQHTRDAMVANLARIRSAFRDEDNGYWCDTFRDPALLKLLNTLELTNDALQTALSPQLEGVAPGSAKLAARLAEAATTLWRNTLEQNADDLPPTLHPILAVIRKIIEIEAKQKTICAALRPHIPNTTSPSKREWERLCMVIQEAFRRLLPAPLAEEAADSGTDTAYSQTCRHWANAIAALAEAQHLTPPTAILTDQAGLLAIKSNLERA